MLIRRISLILAALYFTSHLFLAGCATTDDEEMAEDDDTEEVSDENSEENGEESAEDENGNQNSDGNNEFAENNNENQGDDENTEEDGDEEANLAEDNFDNSGEELAESTNQDLQQMINEAEAENTASAGEAPIDPLPEDAASNNVATNNASSNNVASAPAGDVPMNSSASTSEAPAASAGFALPEMGSKMPYIIQAGDTLESIAGRIYGNPSKWVEIQELSSIQNPNNVHPGDVVYYQLTNDSMAFASNYEGLARSEVVVKAGDTLSGIAQELTGSYENWKTIWRQNDTIENPDQISVGQKIYYVNASLLSATINFVKNVKVANVLKIDTNKNTKSVDSDSNLQQQQDNNQNSVKSGKTLSQLSVKNILSDFGFSMNFAS